MASRHDEHGQPNPNFGRARVTTRKIDEFIGMCRGVLADGAIVQEEAEFILKWLDNNPDAADQWPANVFYQHIGEFLKDGVLDSDEESELIRKMIEILGEVGAEDGHSAISTALPFNDPQPRVIFEGRIFCLTGRFAFGQRKKCKSAIELRGGKTVANPPRLCLTDQESPDICGGRRV